MTIHVSTAGTYHPPEDVENAWSINDTRGYLGTGPSCSECGACECIYDAYKSLEAHEQWDGDEDFECVGLSFAYVNMDDGADSLCEDCATKASITIVPCDCS